MANGIAVARGQSAGARPISGLFSRAYRDLLAGRIRLPSMPDVAVRLRAAMQKQDVRIADAARIIQADASTAGYLIAVANSPIYRGVNPVTSVEKGMMRLGLKTTRNLVTAHSMRAMFSTSSRLLASALRETWVRSARTAAFAALLARRCRGHSPDQAMLAGLLMDIGCLPLLRVVAESSGPMPEPERLAVSLAEFAPNVGVVVLEKWEFDPTLVDVARYRHQFDREHDGEGDLIDLGLVARRLALVGHEQGLTLPPVDTLPAFDRLDLRGLPVKEAIDMLLAADAELADLMKLLGVSA